MFRIMNIGKAMTKIGQMVAGYKKLGSLTGDVGYNISNVNINLSGVICRVWGFTPTYSWLVFEHPCITLSRYHTCVEDSELLDRPTGSQAAR